MADPANPDMRQARHHRRPRHRQRPLPGRQRPGQPERRLPLRLRRRHRRGRQQERPRRRERPHQLPGVRLAGQPGQRRRDGRAGRASPTPAPPGSSTPTSGDTDSASTVVGDGTLNFDSTGKLKGSTGTDSQHRPHRHRRQVADERSSLDFERRHLPGQQRLDAGHDQPGRVADRHAGQLLRRRRRDHQRRPTATARPSTLGQVALASFANNDGLVDKGGNVFMDRRRQRRRRHLQARRPGGRADSVRRAGAEQRGPVPRVRQPDRRLHRLLRRQPGHLHQQPVNHGPAEFVRYFGVLEAEPRSANDRSSHDSTHPTERPGVRPQRREDPLRRKSTPDTMVCCDTGDKVMVLETLQEVMRRAIDYARVIRRPVTD